MKDDLVGGRGPVINPLKYPSIKCDSCGGELFEEKIIIKNIPGMIAGTGTEDYPYPVPVLVCSKCGTIEKSYRELLEKGAKYQEENKEATKGTSLIL
jgi:DNA-directed RNA polymerase subunit M/transcription elongation factor TFIIS